MEKALRRRDGSRKYRKLPVKLKAHVGEFELIRQYYSLPVDTDARNSLLLYIAEHPYVKSFLISLAEEALSQFAQCHNDPVIKIDLIEPRRLGIIIDAEVMNVEAEIRLGVLRDWIDDALGVISTIYVDAE